jgi:hypothetical protein
MQTTTKKKVVVVFLRDFIGTPIGKRKKAVFEVIRCDDTIEVSLLGFA